MKKLQIVSVLLLTMAVGCATTQLQTPSGKPDIQINAPESIVSKAILDRIVSKGGIVRSQSENIIVAEYKATVAANLLFGSRFNPDTIERYTFNLIDAEENRTRVVITVEIVSNPHSAYEKVQDFSKAAAPAQQMLLEIKNKVEGKNTPNDANTETRNAGIDNTPITENQKQSL
jgi:PBP1b-binding outer membrane lipoprotein LpoB